MIPGDPPAVGVGNGRATVLVVDDDAAVRAVASKVLRRSGYDVIEAGGGQEAMALIHERGGAVDLLLTDVVMPEVGGRELSERLRAAYPEVRVLFMSAYTEDEVILQGVRVAEVNFLMKPFNLESLTRSVRDVLEAPLARQPPPPRPPRASDR
jgi:CheY-like chemotaxis protein